MQGRRPGPRPPSRRAATCPAAMSRHLSGERLAERSFVARIREVLADQGHPLTAAEYERLIELCGDAHRASGSPSVQLAQLREEPTELKQAQDLSGRRPAALEEEAAGLFQELFQARERAQAAESGESALAELAARRATSPRRAAGRGSCPGRRPQGSPRRRAAPTRLPDHPVQSDEEVRGTEEEPRTALAQNRLALLGAHRAPLLFASGARGARSCSRCPGRCRSHRERRAPSGSHGRSRTRTSKKDDHVVGVDGIGHPSPRAGCGRWGEATVTVLRGAAGLPHARVAVQEAGTVRRGPQRAEASACGSGAAQPVRVRPRPAPWLVRALGALRYRQVRLPQSDGCRVRAVLHRETDAGARLPPD